MNNIKNKKLGFTLIEIIVAAAIFGIVVTVYAGIYIATMKANSKMIAMQKTQNEIRYLMEAIVREVRLGSINYDFYTDNPDNPRSVLALKDSSGNTMYFGSNGSFATISYDAVNWKSFTSNNIKIQKLDFYITPQTSPYSNDVSLKIQPGVLIYIDALYNQNGQMDGEVKLQTFVSSREYK